MPRKFDNRNAAKGCAMKKLEQKGNRQRREAQSRRFRWSSKAIFTVTGAICKNADSWLCRQSRHNVESGSRNSSRKSNSSPKIPRPIKKKETKKSSFLLQRFPSWQKFSLSFWLAPPMARKERLRELVDLWCYRLLFLLSPTALALFLPMPKMAFPEGG